MMQKPGKRKPAPKKRAAATRRRATHSKHDKAQVALATLLALLHADRWLFEAAELAKNGELAGEIEEFNRIRLAIAGLLNRVQPRAYGAMSRGGLARASGC